MLLELKPRPHRNLPEWRGMTGAGLVIGAVSSWVGIGGGTLSVPFLHACNVRFQEAIGTSAAIGLPIALAGALGYAWAGRGVTGLPDHSLGFIYLPAVTVIALASLLTAPLGARLTHQLPVRPLKRVFALILLLTAVRMAYGLAQPAA